MTKKVNNNNVVSVIVKVSTPNYVPKGVTVRMRIDDTMFTGGVKSKLIAEIEKDKQVVSISRSSNLRQID